ncbi:MAG TPA: SDR family oxidoreductase [Lacunisphaera sp.]|jgi:3-oxoacyl-[acyl-carrier protein] reductase|nr:SDR family oxidoreductase [Lacunisphaera sp.]
MKIILTGSSSGIGRALATHLLAGGHEVWGLARRDQADFAARYPGFRASACDVADWPQMERAAVAVAAGWPHVDGLVACAGVQGEIGPAVGADPLRWSATARANLDGTYFAIRAFHALLARGPRRAKIICLSGGGATKARPNFSAYAAAKTGIVRLVETIAAESSGQPLDINAIAPGAINTPMTDEVIALGPGVVGQAEYDAAVKQKASGGAPLGRVLGLVDFLLSAKSDGISGRLLAAPWDPWSGLDRHATALAATDIYTLRRILPEERGARFD